MRVRDYEEAREHQLEILRTLAWHYYDYRNDGYDYEAYVIERLTLQEKIKARDFHITDAEISKAQNEERRSWIPLEKEWNFLRAIEDGRFLESYESNKRYEEDIRHAIWGGRRFF